ncbi:hypothetical protein F5883DRAFT_413721 [Diaporthe sp. PMI_573]|nr:hypothetical protein F5883DRAFT_413721 [Diaporthaceae sp. PMI_573]
MNSSEDFVIEPAAIKELQLIEASLSDVDTEITAKQYLMAKDVLAARQNTISKIPGFWAVVFDHASSELEAAVTGTDLEVFANALKGLEVGRPEIPASASVSDVGLDKFGEPRSVTIRFHFGENKWFSDSLLEKTFWYRYGKDGSAGLVSDPVRVNWQPGHDLTEGLTDAAYAFWAAQKQNPAQQLDGIVTGDARKARDAAARELPEYKALAQRLESATNGAISFFNFFSYRGRWTSAAESDIFPSAIDYFMADTIDSDDELDGLQVDDSDDDDDDDDVEMS